MIWNKLKKKKVCRLNIKQFESRQSLKNEYLIINGQEAATIDAGDSCGEIGRVLAENRVRLKYLLITHAHPLQLRALPELKQKFGGTFCLHQFDHERLQKSGIQIEPDLFVKDNMKLNLGEVAIKVLHTPGHTEGSLCFWAENAGVLFSGSTLLKKGYGRIRGNSSMDLMLFSLKRLNYTVPSETVVYPRTGESTTMGAEPWLNCLRSH